LDSSLLKDCCSQTANYHWQFPELPSQRVQGQPEGFQGEGAQQLAVFFLPEDDICSTYRVSVFE
jgi:hypothetical protein